MTMTIDDIRSRIVSIGAPIDSEQAMQRAAAVQAPSRCEVAMDAIKSYIIRKGLDSGDPLPNEATLCEELGVSRSSVREAIRKLEALRIVTVAHGKGMFVGDMSLEPLVETLSFRAMTDGRNELSNLRDVIEVRRILDLGAAGAVCAAMRGTEQPYLLELTERMIEAAEQGRQFMDEDIEFHSVLLRSAGNQVLSQLANSMWLVHMAILPQLDLSVSDDLVRSAQSHRDMVVAAMAGDVDGYRAAVVDHYAPIAGIVEAYIAKRAGEEKEG
ncbi:MAG: FadR/GntR family transcriptional regulator [Bifidobacterium animalis]|nr:FadR family transcriptional regulator [Bifidobacterium animalis]MDY5040794.1 FadR/GntR family transcriptional regulator [Bifidobacterium animalis]RYN14752.1 transcriptional regulator, GntR family [Bifidobacterium animalis subsp. animalis]